MDGDGGEKGRGMEDGGGRRDGGGAGRRADSNGGGAERGRGSGEGGAEGKGGEGEAGAGGAVRAPGDGAGAVAMPEEDYCRVHLLGVRGETWEREVRTEAMPEGTPLYVYVFAVTEDGRGVSPSACRAFLAEDAAADEEEG